MAVSRDGGGEAVVSRNVPEVHYADVAAQDDALREIRNVIELPLTHSEYFKQLGVPAHRGVILYGPPGNGKTLIAKAVAGESDAHLEIINGPEIKSKWVGESEENVRKVFERATLMEPSVILIDEIDAIAPARSDMEHQHDISLISQLLVCLDGMVDQRRIAVIATTNRIESLDFAVKRPGRFDYHIRISVPDELGRKKILECHLSKMRVEHDVVLDTIVAKTNGFSGAALASLCREAGLQAIQRGIGAGTKPEELNITGFDLEKGLKSILEKRSEE